MSKKKALAMAVWTAVASIGFVMSASAEEHMSTDVAPVVVEGTNIVDGRNTYDGKVIRTGGDVTVVTAAEIEKKAYTSVIDAIKKIPGVDVQQAGYRGFEYEYGEYQDTLSINGDRRVVVLLDGKRMTNEANNSGNSGSFSKASLFNMVGIQNVERIEVIKGASAMAYGTDCTGGVINIITKKGERANTTLGVAYGSWGRQQYKLSNAGRKNKVSWLMSYAKDKRNDSKYVDREYKKTRTYKGSSYDDDNIFAKVDYDFDEHHSLGVNFSYIHNDDEYPVMAPDYSSQQAVANAIANGINMSTSNTYDGLPKSDPAWNRYHRWWYVYGAGSFTKNTSRNFDVKYNFKDDDGIDSYVRVFNNENKYYMDRYRPEMKNFSILSTSGNAKQYTWAKEKSTGVNVRYGKKLNANNTLYTGVDYSNNHVSEDFYFARKDLGGGQFGPLSWMGNTRVKNFKRDTWDAFVQDKIQMNKLTVTPGIRYNYYGKTTGSILDKNGNVTAPDGGKGGNETYSRMTAGLFADYQMDKNQMIYASWSQVFNAPYASNLANALGSTSLKAEKGNAYTLGYSGKSGKSTFGVNYSLVKMNNTYDSILVPLGDVWQRQYTNIKSTIKSFGLNGNYKFDDNWSVAASYCHASKELGKNGDTDAKLTKLTDLTSSLSFNNRYTLGVDYEKSKFSTGFDFTFYTGMNQTFFSDNQFFIVDWHANYKLGKKMSLFAQVNNLTNRAYETKALPREGVGALPMEGRNFLIGCNYSF